MARHPAAAERARAEIDNVLQGRDPGPDDLSVLPWLDATLKEAMRLYPPVAALMSRRTTRDITLGPWRIPRGSMVRLATWVLHHDARWFPEPEAFRPERFLPGAPEIPRGAYLPFGAGPRVCLGQHFATLEMTLLAAMLLQRFTLAVPAGAPPVVPQLAVTLRPRGGLVLHLARRIDRPAPDQREGEAASSAATRVM
jgi:cytochrome P450